MQMTTIRVFFKKTGRAKYISHLDTMRTLTRALRRSGLPLWYTEGFNPHLYLTFALPISLGYESDGESLDIRLVGNISDKELLKRLQQSFPPGFEVVRAATPVMEPKAIAWADYDVVLRYYEAEMTEIEAALQVLLRQPVIEVVKKTKKGEKTVDIKPMVQLLEQQREGRALHLRLRTAAGISLNINPTLFLQAFYKWANMQPDGVRIRRTAILTETLEEFC